MNKTIIHILVFLLYVAAFTGVFAWLLPHLFTVMAIKAGADAAMIIYFATGASFAALFFYGGRMLQRWIEK